MCAGLSQVSQGSTQMLSIPGYGWAHTCVHTCTHTYRAVCNYADTWRGYAAADGLDQRGGVR
jgi:hypothetical protein